MLQIMACGMFKYLLDKMLNARWEEVLVRSSRIFENILKNIFFHVCSLLHLLTSPCLTYLYLACMLVAPFLGTFQACRSKSHCDVESHRRNDSERRASWRYQFILGHPRVMFHLKQFMLKRIRFPTAWGSFLSFSNRNRPTPGNFHFQASSWTCYT